MLMREILINIHFVVDGAGDEILIVEFPGLALSEIERQTVYTVRRVIIQPDGSAFITSNYYNTQTWEDEYPYPEGFQCVLGDSVIFHYNQGSSAFTSLLCVSLFQFVYIAYMDHFW